MAGARVVFGVVIAIALGACSGGSAPALPQPTRATTSITTTVTAAPASASAATTTSVALVTVVPADMLNPAVTQATIATTICATGYTTSIRPSSAVTDALKRRQLAGYGYADANAADYEEDHVIALELGGAPAAPSNLWPQPHASSGGDDTLENDLHTRVCAGRLDLVAAQAQILATKAAHGYRREASVA